VAAGGDAARYAQRLEVGVAIFFVISGFVLYRPFLQARLDGRELPRVGRYGRRRALRIVPAYWLALTVAVVALSLPGVLTAGGIATYYGFGQIYSTETFTGGLVQAWTLCVEVTFYAFLPLWAWAMRRLGPASLLREGLALVGLALFAVAWKAAFVWSGSPDQVVLSPWLHSLPAYFDHFALGMGLAVLVAWRPLPRWAPAAGIVVAVVAFWVVSLRIGIGYQLFEPYSRWQWMGRHFLYGVVGCALVAAALAAVPGRGVVGRVLASRVAVFLGTISYGIYLWHLTTIGVLERFDALPTWHPFLSLAALTLVLTVLVSAASWYWWERPLLRAGSRPWRRAPRPPAADQPAAQRTG
jgi:peptidoglycan/LPS O-acetylase OafA/YrhL